MKSNRGNKEMCNRNSMREKLSHTFEKYEHKMREREREYKKHELRNTEKDKDLLGIVEEPEKKKE